MPARTTLEARLRAAFDTIEMGADPVLRPSERADYQANGALALAKRLGKNPREVAEQVLAAATLDDVCESVEVSGPGFLNCTFSKEFLATCVAEISADSLLGVSQPEKPLTVVVDYSAPNVAKEMHVGNLRSTIIGDALCRMIERLGDHVIRENHLGDWGTPFGMLIEHLVDLGEEEAAHELSVGDLSRFYKEARTSFDANDAFRDRSRQRVVSLQSGDDESIRLWGVLVAESVRYFDDVYTKLGVLLTDDDIMGESAYNSSLPDVVTALDERGLLVEDDGAHCVFPPGFENREGQPLPLIVQKSDGGYGYAATDLAAIRDRVTRLAADRILYVVGAPQSMHLEMCFAVARMAGWLSETTTLEHVSFGSVLGEDKKMFKTRSGESVKLVALLDEAVTRARVAIEAHDAGLEPEDVDAVARAVGIGAVKYADLSVDRVRDYVFDWDRMITFEGNTGPYLQYAHARIRSVFRRGECEPPAQGTVPTLAEPAERALAVALLGYADAIRAAAEASAPHKLCLYLFQLASAFTSFYEQCPVLKAPDEATRVSRLALSDTTARMLGDGLELLGIEAPSRM